MKNCRSLAEIDENAFGSVSTKSQSNPTIVNFEYCNLSMIPKGLFISWRQLSIVRLGGNPLHCDCSVMWMQKEINLTQGETKPASVSYILFSIHSYNTIVDVPHQNRSRI